MSGNSDCCDQPVEYGLGRRVGPLHLVEDTPFVDDRRVDGVELVMPALLREGVRREKRMEHRVEIDVDEIVEVLQVLAGDRVAGLIRKGEGV